MVSNLPEVLLAPTKQHKNQRGRYVNSIRCTHSCPSRYGFPIPIPYQPLSATDSEGIFESPNTAGIQAISARAQTSHPPVISTVLTKPSLFRNVNV